MVEVMVAETMPAQVACRVLADRESGYYARSKRPPSERGVRHAWLMCTRHGVSCLVTA